MNKYKDALTYLRSSALVTDHKQKEMVNQCTAVLQELIDKATPKKPTNCGKTIYIPACPYCGNVLGSTVDNHCSECNQRIDWSDEYE